MYLTRKTAKEGMLKTECVTQNVINDMYFTRKTLQCLQYHQELYNRSFRRTENQLSVPSMSDCSI